MRDLLDFLKKYSYWFLFLVLEGISLFLLFRFNLYQGSVWFTSANTVSGQVLKWESAALSYVALGKQNRDLVRENIVLEQRVKALSELLDRAEHDSTYAEKRQASLLADFGMVNAEVVNNSVNRRNNYLTIDKGELDGVRPEMGVVCGTGIVGIVYLTTPHYAIVMPVLNGKSNISCALRGTDYFGYLRWEGTHPLHASLGDIPRHAHVKEGMTVETSGFSAVFPAGLFVGKVHKVENSDDGLSYKLDVNLGTDFSRLRDVCVLTMPNRVEIDSLQQKVESEK
ncbi:MAG: rod shape-determining protein MreC [Paraprevotella sp.]|nr:rod shape-determining protein MreC [Paraprevotella sp.]